MTVHVYKHVSCDFENPNKITIFPSRVPSQYQVAYNAYLDSSGGEVYSGAGKTYLINNTLVCDIPKSDAVLGNSRPVYLRQEFDGLTDEVKYYYVTSYDILPQTIRLYLALDVFATYYRWARFNADYENNFIIKRSTLKLVDDRLIIIPDEATPINKAAYVRTGIKSVTGLSDQLIFLAKIKYLAAKSIWNQAWTTQLIAFKVTLSPNESNMRQLEKLYNNINNIYEIVSGTFGIGLDAQIEELYIIDSTWVRLGEYGEFRYIDYTDAIAKPITGYRVLGSSYTPIIDRETKYKGYPNTKILIGANEINVPNYLEFSISLTFVYNVTDFDLLLTIENNEPIDIKKYFQVQVANSAQETSLQAIARNVGYITTIGNAAGGAAMSMAQGGPLGAAVAAQQVTGALQSIGGDIITHATQATPPSTCFSSSAFSIFFTDVGDLRTAYIYLLQYNLPGQSQGYLNVQRYGVEWNNKVATLEELIGIEMIVTNSRRYIECDVNVSGIPADYAAQMAVLLNTGVELINGQS